MIANATSEFGRIGNESASTQRAAYELARKAHFWGLGCW